MDTASLFHKYYFADPAYLSGTTQFHNLCQDNLPPSGAILEIGPGPSGRTSDFLSRIGPLTGVDISPEIHSNKALASAYVFDGLRLPFPAASFDGCVSDYVLEHVENPAMHFAEVCRVLRPGAAYIFRTPNLYHYVSAVSRFTPYWFHELVSRKWRSLPAAAHAPYRTFYRCNTLHAVTKQSRPAGLGIATFSMVENEPSYGQSGPLLFYPMFLWERAVNSGPMFQNFRANIFAVLRKESEHAG